MNLKACITCRWYSNRDSTCRTASIIVDANETDDDAPYAPQVTWPHVNADEWCSNWGTDTPVTITSIARSIKERIATAKPTPRTPPA